MKVLLVGVAIIGLAADFVSSQEDENPESRRRVSLPVPEIEVETVSEPARVVKLRGTRGNVTFNFAYVDSPLGESIVPLLEEITEMRVIVHESLREKAVTMNTLLPVRGYGAAADYIETALAMQGVLTVQNGANTLLLLPGDSEDGKLEF